MSKKNKPSPVTKGMFEFFNSIEAGGERLLRYDSELPGSSSPGGIAAHASAYSLATGGRVSTRASKVGVRVFCIKKPERELTWDSFLPLLREYHRTRKAAAHKRAEAEEVAERYDALNEALEIVPELESVDLREEVGVGSARCEHCVSFRVSRRGAYCINPATAEFVHAVTGLIHAGNVVAVPPEGTCQFWAEGLPLAAAGYESKRYRKG